MQLRLSARKGKTKGEANQLRREGHVPAILYSKGQEGEIVSVNGEDFGALMRNLKPGRLPNTVLTLVTENQVERKAIVKGIQYHRTRYDVLHLDLMELHDDVSVSLKVPIELTGLDRSPGVKEGGVPRRVIRHMQVHCLPKDIPPVFELDMSGLGMKQGRRLRHIDLPVGVTTKMNVEEVAALIVKR